MFQQFGDFVARRWRWILVVWALLLIAATGVTKGWINRTGALPFHVPGWEDVSEDGEFAFLPSRMPSLQAESLFERAFPHDLLTSSVVVVVTRESAELNDEDKGFIEKTLKPEIEKIQQEPGSIIAGVRTYTDPQMGRLLESKDHHASLVIIELTTEFLEHRNRETIDRIEALIEQMSPESGTHAKAPQGIHLALSGSATVGRDMINAAQASARSTEAWTIGLVLLLLLAIYRAPFLIFIPLLSVFVAVEVSQMLLIYLSQFKGLGFRPFEGLKTYITVVTYGAGVDYCLFLIARYKEELDRGVTLDQAIATTLGKVGDALTASAATVACGIGMMVFADFGKFQQAGKGMSLSLLLMLAAAMTFTPAMLRLLGHIAFWPRGANAPIPRNAGWISGTSLFSRLLEGASFHRIWERVGEALVRKPGTIWIACIVLMAPFAIWGYLWHSNLSYGLLSELPQTNQSVVGAKAVQSHFPAGEAGPITVLLQVPEGDLDTPEAKVAIQELTDRLYARRDELRIADIRSVYYPWGKNIEVSGLAMITARAKAADFFISQVEGDLNHKVTRLDLVMEMDPFARDSIGQMDVIRSAVEKALPKKGEQNQDGEPLEFGFPEGTVPYFVGTTPSMRDLKTVTDSDQVKVDALVLLVVFLILWALLRKFAISAYLILSVFFSYFVALGMTFAVFYWLDPANFSGLDWKVPMFLFTILIAVGEDYNIFLMTRIDEEQREFGPVEGIRVALLQTGGIISSCGVIMAGTFFSLVLAGSLVGMQQLGFALAVGVLLDTFIVRPILVPAYLIMLYSGRFGALGPWLGGLATAPPQPPAEQTHSLNAKRA